MTVFTSFDRKESNYLKFVLRLVLFSLLPILPKSVWASFFSSGSSFGAGSAVFFPDRRKKPGFFAQFFPTPLWHSPRLYWADISYFYKKEEINSSFSYFLPARHTWLGSLLAPLGNLKRLCVSRH
jgi:hypothetical protein